jgi:hypothetical protein
MSETRATEVQEPAAPTKEVPLWAAALIGAAAAVVGLLPWIATGMRLPLQNLWDAATPPDSMPIALLPFSQYSLSHLLGLIVLGSAVAGVTARAVRTRLPRGGFAVIFGATIVVQAAATAQSAVVVRSGLQDRMESTLYLAALVAVCALSILLGALALVLIARAPRAGALIGLTIGSIAASQWISAALSPSVTAGPEWAYSLAGLIQWVAPVLVGVAIAWTGVDTVGRVVSALASLVLVWIAPALITAVTSAAGSRVLAHDPPAMIEYALQVLRMALFIPELALRPIIATAVVAAIGLAVRGAIHRRAVREPALDA